MSKIIDSAIEYVKEIFKDVHGSHDFSHTMRVYKIALEIAKEYSEVDIELVSLSALLHDVDDYKYFATKDNENAKKFLKSQNIPEDKIAEICRIINEISFSKNQGRKPSSLEAMIVQDADRLDAIGAIGVARTFSFGGEKGRTIEQSINHFHEKLLLLKDMMNTDVAKRIAEERHQYLLEFLKEYDKESMI